MSTYSLDLITRGLDRPAARAAELGARSWTTLLAPSLVGLGGIAAAMTLARFIEPATTTLASHRDVLRTFIEVVLILLPAAAIGAVYFRLKVSLRRFTAGAGLGLLAAAVVALSSLPLLAFITLAASKIVVPAYWSPAVIVAVAALGTLGGFITRVTDFFDPSGRAWLFTRAWVASTFALFALRLLQGA